MSRYGLSTVHFVQGEAPVLIDRHATCHSPTCRCTYSRTWLYTIAAHRVYQGAHMPLHQLSRLALTSSRRDSVTSDLCGVMVSCRTYNGQQRFGLHALSAP